MHLVATVSKHIETVHFNIESIYVLELANISHGPSHCSAGLVAINKSSGAGDEYDTVGNKTEQMSGERQCDISKHMMK